MKHTIAVTLAALVLMLTACSTSKIMAKVEGTNEKKVAKNIVYMIVDGMGFEHVKAARIYNGQKPLSFEQFPCTSKVTTCSFEGADPAGHCLTDTTDVTDSAAAATAIAASAKVKNGAISRNLPVAETDIETILEKAKRQGKSTGVIATKLFTDATPAAFVSHANDRDETTEILKDIFQETTPNVVFGADTALHRGYVSSSKAPYQTVYNATDLASVAQKIAQDGPCSGVSCPYVYGGFGEHSMIPGIFEKKSGLPLEITPEKKFTELGVPHLSQMTDAALSILSKNDQGFFLMVESSMPDMISHSNAQIDGLKKGPKAIEVLVREMKEVENTIRVIEAFVAKNPDTLVILTADHETGGLVIEEDKTLCLGQTGCVPAVRWTSAKYEPTPESESRHTAADVPLYAMGKGSERFCMAKINNTDINSLALAQ